MAHGILLNKYEAEIDYNAINRDYDVFGNMVFWIKWFRASFYEGYRKTKSTKKEIDIVFYI